MPTYESLPRSSRSSSQTRRRSFSGSSSSSSLDQYSRAKNKKSPLRLLLAPIHVLLVLPRRLLRLISHRRRPLSLFLLTISTTLLVILLLTSLNAPYAPSNAPPFSLAPSTAASETVFIAANILSRSLILGAWGDSLVELIQLIGPERVFVSIYGGPGDALRVLDGRLERLGVGRRIVDEEEDSKTGREEGKAGKWDAMGIKSVRLPGGERRIKRIAWLAALRNKVLEPLYHPSTSSSISQTRPTKILFLNDIFFTPQSALRLLFGTALNTNGNGLTDYKAVCAADFVSMGWKYYDTFATRDTAGYGIGVPIFPWFAVGDINREGEGEGVSRRDVLEGRDAVRVKSCWGGMVSFRGSYFWWKGNEGGDYEGADRSRSKDKVSSTAQSTSTIQQVDSKKDEHTNTNAKQNGIGIPSLPLRFRSEPEPFWDSSECCLIHADIMALPDLPSSLSSSSSSSSSSNSDLNPGSNPNNAEFKGSDPHDTGIYLNPFVRTSYTLSTHKYIPLAQHFERLLSPIQRVLNDLAGMPVWNARRTEREGERVRDRVWVIRRGETGEDVESVVGWAKGGFEGEVDVAVDVAGTDTEGNSDGAGKRGEELDPGKQIKKERKISKREVLGKVQGKEFWAEQGFYVDYERTARRGGYCGVRQLLVMKEGVVGEGEGNWDNLLDRVPPVDV